MSYPNNDLLLTALKATYISTGVAGFVLGPIPVLNVVGVGLLKLSGHALNQYERFTIKKIAALPSHKAAKLLDQALLDFDHPKDPKIYLALAIAACVDDADLGVNILRVWVANYEGDGTTRYNGVDRSVQEDFKEVKTLMAPFMSRSIGDINTQPKNPNKPRR